MCVTVDLHWLLRLLCHAFWFVFNACRLDPRRRHGIVMGKQPEDLVLAWPRDLSHYPPGYPPAQPPGCCTQRCHCMDGTKRQKSDGFAVVQWCSMCFFGRVEMLGSPRCQMKFGSLSKFSGCQDPTVWKSSFKPLWNATETNMYRNIEICTILRNIFVQNPLIWMFLISE